ncbi:MAG: hypothetical protein ABW215_01960 [Kibdelosporangium sp.]
MKVPDGKPPTGPGWFELAGDRSLADAPDVAGLAIVSNSDIVDLAGLERLPSLVSLRIKDCPRLRDLSALARTAVGELLLDPVVGDLASLAGARVRRLTLVGAVAGLPALPLRMLSVVGVPRVGDLLRFPELTHLVLHRPKAAELVRLRVLTGLQEIDVHAPDGPVADALPGFLVRVHSS